MENDDNYTGPEKDKVYVEYYQVPFSLFFADLARRNLPDIHQLRRSFWNLIAPGEYGPKTGREFVLSYLKRLEREFESVIGRQSLAYWLHLYRRLAPGPAGENTSPATISWTRIIFETAIHKYSRLEKCDRIARSDEISEEKIFRGLLMAKEYDWIRLVISQRPQLVLTDFSTNEMQEFCEIEKVAYEVWKSTAALRILGKGATLVVVPIEPYFADNRPDELDRLVTHFDQRQRTLDASATGTVFQTLTDAGTVALPSYNIDRTPAEDLLKPLGIEARSTFGDELVTNFYWGPFDLRGYYQAHRPLETGFLELHGVSLGSVLAVIGAICIRQLTVWSKDESQIIRSFQRAYEGPFEKHDILKGIEEALPAARELLGMDAQEQIDIEQAFSFLCLLPSKRSSVDIVTAGPLFPFLPYQDRYFLDYCWLHRLLFYLFYNVQMADQNFKADALEKCVHRGHSALPTGPCLNFAGEAKQIDAAFDAGSTLVIVECKVVARSLGFDRGDPTAIKYRNDKITQALKEADEKARWLAKSPLGRNYDVRRFQTLLPLAVTPFVEYIPSEEKRYWISKNLPRVLNPTELASALQDGALNDSSWNCVEVEKLPA